MNEVQKIAVGTKRKNSTSRPPGPKGTPIMGVMRDFNRDQLGFIERARDKYGDVVWMRFLYVPALFLYHPDEVEYVLVTNPKNFIKSMSLRSNFFQRLVGKGLLTSEGEEWKRQRRLSQPAFHRERVASYGQVMVDYSNRLTAKWKEGESRDVHPDMMRLTLEIVVQCLFGADVSTDVDEVGATLKELVKPFASQATVKWILNNRLPTPAHLRFHALSRKIDKVVYRIISERRASGPESDQGKGDLLSMLVAARDEDGSQMTDRQLRDEVMTLFLAGHETTALTLAWSWYLLGTHPEAEKKFHAELDQVLGGRPPTAADLPRLKFTEQITKESMRLYPPAYGLGREAINDCEIGGYRVPKGTQVFLFQWATQRDPRFYDEPEAFRPERWTEEFVERLPKYAYFPFGGGPRGCIGASFAIMEIILCLATIGQRFRLELDQDHPVSIFPAMSLRPRDGIKVVVKSRQLQ
jgi:cytochrome P450